MNTVTIIAWGLRHGPMPEALLQFDLRHLKNPYRDRKLRYLTGLDERVQNEVFSKGLAKRTFNQCLGEVSRAVAVRDTFTVVFACSGGKHRSVSFAERLADELEQRDIGAIREYPFI